MMADTTDFSRLLPELRFCLRETDGGACLECGCGYFTEAELLALLEKHAGDVRAAAYEGLLRKADDDGLTLPDGLEIPSRRAYWLRLAAFYRPPGSRSMVREDEIFNAECRMLNA